MRWVCGLLEGYMSSKMRRSGRGSQIHSPLGLLTVCNKWTTDVKWHENKHKISDSCIHLTQMSGVTLLCSSVNILPWVVERISTRETKICFLSTWDAECMLSSHWNCYLSSYNVKILYCRFQEGDWCWIERDFMLLPIHSYTSGQDSSIRARH